MRRIGCLSNIYVANSSSFCGSSEKRSLLLSDTSELQQPVLSGYNTDAFRDGQFVPVFVKLC